MKIKRSAVLTLENVFTGMLEEKMNPELSFKIACNIVSIGEHAEKIKKAYKPVDGYDVFEDARRDLLQKLGTPSGDGRYSFTPDKATEFNKLQDELNEEHSEVVKAQEKYIEAFNLMLEKTMEIDIEKINLKELTVDIEPAKLVIMIQTGIIDNGSGTGDV